jgi:hypothetical protein
MKTFSVGRLLGLALVIVATASTAPAAMFYHEDFNYPNGDLVPGGVPTNGPNAPNPPLWDDHSGTGTFIQVNNGTISTTAGAGSRQDVNLPTLSTLGQGQTWYAGFDLTVNGPISVTGATEEYFAHFLQGTSNFNGRVYVSAPQAGGGYRLGVVGGSNTPSIKFPTDLNLGQTYRVVVSYTLDPDNNTTTQDSFSKLWVDPVNELSTSVTSVSNFSNALTAFAFRQGTTAGIGTQVIDCLQVATTFDEAAICIPEPTTAALTLLAALGVVGSIRRRIR